MNFLGYIQAIITTLLFGSLIYLAKNFINSTNEDQSKVKKSKKKTKKKLKGISKDQVEDPQRKEDKNKESSQSTTKSCLKKLDEANHEMSSAQSKVASQEEEKQKTLKCSSSAGNNSRDVQQNHLDSTKSSGLVKKSIVIDDNLSDSSDAGRSASDKLLKQGFHVTTLGVTNRKNSIPLKFSEGQEVLARYKGGDEWFRGVISKVTRDKTFTISYLDGEVESKVPDSLIRPITGDCDTTTTVGITEDIAPLNPEILSDDCSWDFDNDDGWEVVKAKPCAVRNRSHPKESIGKDGLTKKQRESRRKKEKLKENKERLRIESQEKGLHALWGGQMRKWTSASAQQ